MKKLYITEKTSEYMSEAQILNAKRFAQEKHNNQKKEDKTTPYSEHLEGVVFRLKNLGVTESNTICAAWLHDVLEKTDVTFEEINKRFGREISVLVLALSKNPNLPKKDMETQYIRQLKEAPKDAKIIKLCDISSNLKEIANAPISKTQKNKKIRKSLHYMRAIKSEISERKAQYPKIQDIVDGINSVAIKFKQQPIKI